VQDVLARDAGGDGAFVDGEDTVRPLRAEALIESRSVALRAAEAAEEHRRTAERLERERRQFKPRGRASRTQSVPTVTGSPPGR
jgi:hypothetical protein